MHIGKSPHLIKAFIVGVCISAIAISITGSHTIAAEPLEYNSYGEVSYDYNQDGVSEFIFDSNDLYNTDTTYIDSAGEYVDAAKILEKGVLEAVE